MTLTLEVTPDLELHLRRAAGRKGLDAKSFVLGLLREQLARQNPAPEVRKESELLAEINRGLSADQWKNYRELIAKRRAETLTSDEHAELIAITDQLEEDNVHRIKCLAELARRRQMSIDALMGELGIQPVVDG